MDNADKVINRLASAAHGVVSRQELLTNGVSDKEIRRRRESGVLVAVHPGVYRHAAVPATNDGRLLAAALAAGQGAVGSRRSAAVMHGLRGVRWSRPEITSPHEDLPRLVGVMSHRTRQLDTADVTTVRGVPVTTIPRTLLDLGAALPFEVVEQAAQDAIIRNLTTAPQLIALLERVGRRGRNGTAVLRAIVAQSLPDERLQSELERRLHVLIQRAALPAPVLQHPVPRPNGEPFLLDFAWPDLMIAVEADGRRWHATKHDFERGLLRERQLRAGGWDVHHFGWSDVVEHPVDVVAHLSTLSSAIAA